MQVVAQQGLVLTEAQLVEDAIVALALEQPAFAPMPSTYFLSERGLRGQL